MTKEQAQRLFAYDRWANERMLQAFEAVAPLDGSSLIARLFSHILAAQQMWLRRVQGSDLTGLTPWPDPEPEAWPRLLQTVQAAWLEQVETREATWETPITYQNTRGRSFETPLHEIVTHIIIHGQHHRAQIAIHLRNQGLTPPHTDFIFFTRDTAPT